jgi:hypothetical protein
VVVLLLGALESLVPAGQVEPLTRAILTFLEASSADGRGRPEAKALFEDAERQASSLPPPAREIMRAVIARDIDAIGPKLLPLVETLGGDPALSPERSPVPRAPIFLLHGADDDVIPADETERLAAFYDAAGHGEVRALLTPYLTHATVDADVPPADAIALLRFWTAAMQALR